MSIYFIFYSLIGLLQKTLFHWKKGLEVWRWSDEKLVIYSSTCMWMNTRSDHCKIIMYYTSILVNTWPRSMIGHIKIMSPRNIPLLLLKQMSVLRLVSNAVTKLWSEHPVHLNMKARANFQIHDYYRNSISIKCTVKCCSSRFQLLLITRTQQSPEMYQLLDFELISSSASPPWFEAQTRFTYRCLKIN